MSDEKPKKDVKTEEKRLEKERKVFLDELFNDVYAKRKRIYTVNFFRGIFFGMGTFIGGTVGIAFIVWALTNFFSDWPVIEKLIDALSR